MHSEKRPRPEECAVGTHKEQAGSAACAGCPASSTSPAGRVVKSHFFAKRCSCNLTSTQISDMCVEAAKYAQSILGIGHSEVTYEQVIQNYLYDNRIPTRRQVRFYEHVNRDIIPTGILDLEVDRCVLLELKAGHSEITQENIVQLDRYMKSAAKTYTARPLIGMVVLFSKKGCVKIFEQKII